MDALKIFIAGDSTVQNCASSYKPQGWGKMSRSTLRAMCTYIIMLLEEEARKALSMKTAGNHSGANWIWDYLLVQFGHNDEKLDGRYADPYGTYQAYLKQYIDGAREKGATPVLLSPVNRRRFDLFHEFYLTHGAYPQAVEELCRDLDVPYIDLTALSAEYYTLLGEEESRKLFLFLKPGESENYPDGSEDNTHFNEYGAAEIAGLVVKGLKQLALPLTQYLKD